MAQTTILSNCKVFPANGSPLLANAAIAIQDNRLRAVGPREQIEATEASWAEATKLDMGGATVLPGLMNLHVHFSLIYPVGAQPPGWEATIPWRIARAAEAALQAGVTTCRTTGEAHHHDIAFKKAVAAGLAVGPRVVAAGRGITPTGGHGAGSPWYIEADGPEDFRRKARQELKAGADHLKLMVTMGIGAPAAVRGLPRLTLEEASAVTMVAHALGKTVCAHVGGEAGARLAVQAGVDCLEHCYTLDDEAVAMMADAGSYIVPTLCVNNSPDFMRQIGMPEARLKLMEDEGKRHLEWFHRAVRAGVRPAVGTDMLPTDRPDVPDFPIAQNWEMELMVRAGLSPAEAIEAATRNAAEICQLSDQVGTLEAGKLADLIAIPGDPTTDITRLRDLRFVMKNGVVVRNTLDHPPSP
jgi:imidazolonepropionase-like amidohydrolase